jgi:hypothetical protein
MLLQQAVPYEQLLGPYGLLVALVIAVIWLSRFFLKQMNDLRVERDFWRDKSLQLLETAASAVDSAVKLAPEDSIAQMARIVDAARKRGEI